MPLQDSLGRQGSGHSSGRQIALSCSGQILHFGRNLLKAMVESCNVLLCGVMVFMTTRHCFRPHSIKDAWSCLQIVFAFHNHSEFRATLGSF